MELDRVPTKLARPVGPPTPAGGVLKEQFKTIAIVVAENAYYVGMLPVLLFFHSTIYYSIGVVLSTPV